MNMHIEEAVPSKYQGTKTEPWGNLALRALTGNRTVMIFILRTISQGFLSSIPKVSSHIFVPLAVRTLLCHRTPGAHYHWFLDRESKAQKPELNSLVKSISTRLIFTLRWNSAWKPGVKCTQHCILCRFFRQLSIRQLGFSCVRISNVRTVGFVESWPWALRILTGPIRLRDVTSPSSLCHPYLHNISSLQWLPTYTSKLM